MVITGGGGSGVSITSLTTEYKSFWVEGGSWGGYYLFLKKSSDGKTIYAYPNDSRLQNEFCLIGFS